MSQESTSSRPVRWVGNVVFAIPRAVRWFGRQFMLGVRSGIESARESEKRTGR